MFRWNTLFIDRPTDRFDEALAFWTAVTGTRPSERRGTHGEFATLLPERGDACLRAQAVGGPGGAHLDLDVADLTAARKHARRAGAVTIAEPAGLSVLRSPAGLLFCLTTDSGHLVPPPVTAPDGSSSRADQICLDIPARDYLAEVTFWATLTGWDTAPTTEPEFTRLRVPDQLPVRILLQRKENDEPPGAHPDFACSDPAATAAWHESLGARQRAAAPHRLVMTDPTGGVYCLTARDPFEGAA